MIGKSTPFAQKVLIVISIIGLIIIGVVVVLVPMLYNDILASTNVDTSTEVAEPKAPGSDPYITFVPEDQRSTSSKTNIFISSLDPTYGPNTAKVYVIIFGSILDPNVHAMMQHVNDLQAKYNEDITFVWKDYIDVADTNAMDAAVVMQCLNELGRFWEMSALLSSRGVTSNQAVVDELGTAGISSLQYSDCQANAGYSALISQGVSKAQADGISAGATVFINDQSFSATALDEIDAAIESAIQSYSRTTTE